MRKNKVFIGLIVAGFLSACIDKNETSNSYYLPSPHKKTDTIQFFSSTSNKHRTWLIELDQIDQVLRTVRLNSDSDTLDILSEKITPDGSELLDYQLYIYDQGFKMKPKFYPIERDIMRWDLSKPSVYSGEFIHGNVIYEFRRVRRFYEQRSDTLIFTDMVKMNLAEGQVPEHADWLYDNSYHQEVKFKIDEGMVQFSKIYRDSSVERFVKK